MNEKLVRALRDKPVRFAKLVGFDLLTDIHNDWIREMTFGHQDETLLGHRGSYKTTCLSVSIALIVILMPDQNTIFIRKTDDDVIEVVRQAVKILHTDLFRYLVKEIYGVDLSVDSSAYKIDTNLHTSVDGAPQLLGMGIGASITGKHADNVFTDDIVNLKDRVSRAERELTKTRYMELQNIKNRNGRIFNTGTPWHKEDAISLMPNVKRYDCYSTGLISTEELKELRSSMSDSLFAANYELKHIADKDAMFKNPQFVSDEALIYDGVAHIDAAYGGADGTAYTIFKKLPDGRFIGYGRRWDKHVKDCLTEIVALHSRFRAGTIENESNADKGFLRKELKDLGLPVHGYHESMNKYIKISTYLRKHWGQIWWLDGTDPEYINEILDYSEYAEHDDAPDSAASLLRQMTSRAKLNTNIKGGI